MVLSLSNQGFSLHDQANIIDVQILNDELCQDHEGRMNLI